MKRLAGLGLLLLVACDAPPDMKPGYDGPILSSDGMNVLQGLQGKPLKDVPPSFGPGAWIVGPFSVTPCPWGKGPHVMIEQGATVRHLPMESDGDAADLYRRVEGKAHATLTGPPSARYESLIR